MNRATCIILALALGGAPSTAAAQHVASERAGIPPRVTLALTSRADTLATDSIAPHRSRVHDAVVGGGIGFLAGLVAGGVQAHRDERGCKGDICALSALDLPILGGAGLVAGAIVGALWPTH